MDVTALRRVVSVLEWTPTSAGQWYQPSGMEEAEGGLVMVRMQTVPQARWLLSCALKEEKDCIC